MSPPAVHLGVAAALTLTCTSCEELIEGAPVFDDGRAYCCRGCAAGGPCLCDYQHGSGDAAIDAPRRAGGAPVEPGDALAPALLRVSGFYDQRELLAFGLALEERPEVDTLALVRARLDDCWFAVGIADPPTLARVVRELSAFEVAADVQDAGVEACVHARVRTGPNEPPAPAAPPSPSTQRRVAPPPPAAATPDAPPLVVPSRPRFRLQAGGVAAAAAVAQPELAPFEAPERAEATPAAAPTPPGVVAAADRPGGAAPIREHFTLVASPFRSFVTLGEFQDAVRELPGVTDIRVRRFYRGSLQLAVDYDDVLPFTTRLRELRAGEWTLVSESPDLVEIALGGDPPDVASDA